MRASSIASSIARKDLIAVGENGVAVAAGQLRAKQAGEVVRVARFRRADGAAGLEGDLVLREKQQEGDHGRRRKQDDERPGGPGAYPSVEALAFWCRARDWGLPLRAPRYAQAGLGVRMQSFRLTVL